MAKLKIYQAGLLCFAVLIGVSGESKGDPYYTVHQVSFVSSAPDATTGQAQSIYRDLQTGSLIPFSYSSLHQLSQSEAQRLPSVERFDPRLVGTQSDPIVSFQMRAIGENHYGTVIGFVPRGDEFAQPWDSLTYGYTGGGPRGGSVEFVPLTVTDGQNVFLNQLNQILVAGWFGADGPPGMQSRLIDMNSGKSLDLSSQILPPNSPALEPEGLADNGSILASAPSDNGNSLYILTPPDVVVSTPEPSPAATLVAGLGGMAAFLRFRQRRAR